MTEKKRKASTTATYRAVRYADDEGMSFVATKTEHAGPLPSPEALARYEEMAPGSVDRIFTMAERQLERNYRAAMVEAFRPYVGMLFGFLLIAGALALSTYLSLHGAVAGAWSVVVIGLVPAVVALITGRTAKAPSKTSEDS